MTKRSQTFWLTVCTVLCMAASPVAMVVALMSPIAIDRQSGAFNPIAWLTFLLMITLWVVCILGPFGGWVMFSRNNSRMAWSLMAAPLAWTLLIAALLAVLTR